MSKFVIEGGKALQGEIRVSGSKNAALPIIFASLITRGKTILSGVPDIKDVRTALDIIGILGARVSFSSGILLIDTEGLSFKEVPSELVASLRASAYLIGACLSRFGEARLYKTGGCNFDKRPIDMHINCALSMGAEIFEDRLSCKRLFGTDIRFEKISVGATVNAIIMAASAKGRTRIFGYAREPHVMSLIDYLCGCGAKIAVGEQCIEIEGRALVGSYAKIIPDMIEAGTYIALSLMGNNKIRVRGADFGHLDSYLNSLCYGGASFEFSCDCISPISKINEPLNVETAPYPAFPTDLQPLVAPLLAISEGGVIKEGVWHNRFGYLSVLSEFGIRSNIGCGYAKIYKSDIRSACATAPDLRGGAAMLLSALIAKGESVLLGAELIKRGYEDVCAKLKNVGALIEEI